MFSLELSHQRVETCGPRQATDLGDDLIRDRRRQHQRGVAAEFGVQLGGRQGKIDAAARMVLASFESPAIAQSHGHVSDELSGIVDGLVEIVADRGRDPQNPLVTDGVGGGRGDNARDCTRAGGGLR